MTVVMWGVGLLEAGIADGEAVTFLCALGHSGMPNGVYLHRQESDLQIPLASCLDEFAVRSRVMISATPPVRCSRSAVVENENVLLALDDSCRLSEGI